MWRMLWYWEAKGALGAMPEVWLSQWLGIRGGSMKELHSWILRRERSSVEGGRVALGDCWMWLGRAWNRDRVQIRSVARDEIIKNLMSCWRASNFFPKVAKSPWRILSWFLSDLCFFFNLIASCASFPSPFQILSYLFWFFPFFKWCFKFFLCSFGVFLNT